MIIGAAAALSVVAVLAGCSLSPLDLAIFDREQQASDLPPSLDNLPDTIYRDTVRYIGEDSIGTKYFASEANDPQGSAVCLTVVASDDDWSTGCSTLPPVEVTIASGLRATLEPDAAGGDEQVGGYVSVELPAS
ncbi:hypothetical protein M3147_16410 [Agromyces mediolanus]|uniref:hypothetical protein n=1 Tax=Agromyces mediolanus TaxID=41986 RepID=UPI00203BE4AD|nr:hypothetical protein [Agromyces mediolanus]MCM3658841.1 hypothetical protein [Agromyces mediolanus]